MMMVCFGLFQLSAQDAEVDSVKRLIQSYESPCNKPCIDDTILVDLHLKLGVFFEASQPDSAQQLYHEAVRLSKSVGALKHESKAWSYLGIVNWSTGAYDSAINCHMRALKIRDQLDDQILVAYSSNNIGLVYFSMGQFEDAADAYRRSLSVYERLKDPRGQSASFTNLGLVKRYQQEHDSAVFYFEKSMKIDLELNDQNGVAIGYNNMGNAAKDNGDFDEARKYFGQALNYFEEQGNERSACVVYGNIASCYTLEKDFETALGFAQQGVELAKRSGTLAELKENYRQLSDALEGAGKHQESLEYYKEFVHLKDSLVNLDRLKQVNEIKEKYDNERQQKENAMTKLKLSESTRRLNFFIWLAVLGFLLAVVAVVRFINKRKTNRELKFKNQQIIGQKLRLTESLAEVKKLNNELERSNRAKDKFFSILAHDLKGPVLSIKQAIAMVHNHFDTFSSEEIKQYLDKLKGSSERANNLLVNLLDWSLSQKGLISFTPEKQDITEMIGQNVQLKRAIAEQKEIEMKWEPGAAVSAHCDFGMINTVIRNLISNALKFTPPGGEVHVVLEERKEEVKVMVRDTGVGMAEDKVKSLFRIDEAQSENGTEGEQGTGLGLILCKEFVEMHNGTISVTSRLEEGTEFSFTLPKNSAK